MQLEEIVGNLNAQKEQDKAKLRESNATLRSLQVELRAAQDALKQHENDAGNVQDAPDELANGGAPNIQRDLIVRCTILVRLLARSRRCFSLILALPPLTCTAARPFTCAHKHHSGCWGR